MWIITRLVTNSKKKLTPFDGIAVDVLDCANVGWFDAIWIDAIDGILLSGLDGAFDYLQMIQS